MNLVADIGNSSTKLAVFDNTKLVALERQESPGIDFLENLIGKWQIRRSIISSVREIPESIETIFRNEIPFMHILSHESKLPFKIAYETPDTLGPDRIAAVAGGFSAFPGSDLLIIDAGTAITYEVLTGDIYAGGNISPGIEMRFRALNAFTGRLPLVTYDESYTFPAVNTTDAIRAGVITGVVYEINEYIRTFEKKYKNLKIILTGGDSTVLSPKVAAECMLMPELVINGLNYILDYNAQ
jgi:type III pantothenate kinase